MKAMCARLSAALDALIRSDAEVSRLLGYANSTTLARMRRGETFVDSERLATLGRVVFAKGVSINLHWILTGQGSPLIGSEADESVKAMSVLIAAGVLRSSLTLVT